MALWIKFLQTRAQHAYRLPSNVQGSLVRSTINPQRQPAGNYKTGPGQAAGKGCGCIQTWPSSTSATDHRQLRFFQNPRLARYK